MNNWNGIGRLTKDPTINYKERKKEDDLCIARFTLAIDRPGSEDADFISCLAFGKTAEFIEKYFEKGLRVGVSGRIQTGSYENDKGDTIYTTDVVADRVEFADGKKEDNKGGRRK